MGCYKDFLFQGVCGPTGRACIQMILLYNGESVSQSDIAAKVFGECYNRTASGNQIEAAFDGWHGYSVHSYQSKKFRKHPKKADCL